MEDGTRQGNAADHPDPSAGRLPARFANQAELDDFLSQPGPDLISDLEEVDGDILILGVAGKMGPTLARLAKNAGPARRIIGVARFSDPQLKTRLESWGIETIAADLLEPGRLEALPRSRNVLFMAGRKFGSSGNQALTWAMNVHLPAMVASTFRESRIVAFSTGNIYPLVDVLHQGATEDTPPGPRGEYAQSCLGRERMFEYFSGLHGTSGRIFRLNYAIDMRYGVLVDLASRVKAGEQIDLSLMGHVNVIWQGDANAQALRLLAHCTTPTTPLNVSGPETLSVRWLAHELGARLGVEPRLEGSEAETAWLTNSAAAARLFGYPSVPVATMLDWVADWIGRDGPVYGKPTKYEVRDGSF
jgi:nucleoside-diphosphate-sugar epimerase